jgi:lysyl-tRNA synthetase, class II
VPGPVAEQVGEITRAWVDIKGGAERGFSMTLGRFPRAEDRDCEITVALQGDIVLGFLSVVPVYGIESWSLDAMRRRPDSPNGLMEFLVIRLAEQYRERGFQRLSLNFASLANSANDIDSRMLEETRRFIFENLSSFYQLKSLAQFNNKFAPQWRSRFLAYGDMLTFPKLVLAVVQSEDPIKFPRRMTGRREAP